MDSTQALNPTGVTITFSRSLEMPIVNRPEIVPHQCEHYPTHTCTRCQPGEPLCLAPEDAAIYHGDVDGDSE